MINSPATTSFNDVHTKHTLTNMAASALVLPPFETVSNLSDQCDMPTPSYLPTPPSFACSPNPQVKALPRVDIPFVHQGSTEKVMQARITELTNAMEDEDAFFVSDLGEVYKALMSWRRCLTRVEPFYAVKCNPDPAVLHLLSLCGTGFDCASQAEIMSVLSLPVPASPSKIIFANPCKPTSFIRAARSFGVDMMTFDNADELLKISKLYPTAKLVLRLLTDDSKSLCRLGLKFGAPVETCEGLLELASRLGLDVIGVSFHVGSGCKDPQMFEDACERARRVFDLGVQFGYRFGLLDIGGGFEKEYFETAASVLNRALDRFFPVESGVRIIGEPGRFLVSTAFVLATNVVARRSARTTYAGVLEEDALMNSLSGGGGAAAAEGAGATTPTSEGDEAGDMMTSSIFSLDGSLEGSKHLGDVGDDEQTPKVMYYINDGVYGSFNCIMFDHQIVHPFPLTLRAGTVTCPFPRSFPPNISLEEDLTVQMGYQRVPGGTEMASVWGPTCDSIDCVRNMVVLPRSLEVGDWLGWGEMGAYTCCAASTFNGFKKSTVLYTSGGDAVAALEVNRILASCSLST